MSHQLNILWYFFLRVSILWNLELLRLDYRLSSILHYKSQLSIYHVHY